LYSRPCRMTARHLLHTPPVALLSNRMCQSEPKLAPCSGPRGTDCDGGSGGFSRASDANDPGAAGHGDPAGRSAAWRL
jgi:hypothetical protein